MTPIEQKARSLALRRHSVTIYVYADKDIYYDGLSYRTRVQHNGIRISKNFKHRTDAVKYRNNLYRFITPSK